MQKNRILCVCLLLVILGGIAFFYIEQSKWGPRNCDARLSISLLSTNGDVKVGDKITLLVKVKNLSNEQPISVYHALGAKVSPFDGLYCTIISPTGKDLSQKLPRHEIGGSGDSILINPGEIGKFEYQISDICNFDDVGKYKIVGKKGIYLGQDKTCEIISNPLYISVAPADRK